MERIELTGNVKKVVPKHGRGDTIEVTLVAPFTQAALVGLTDCMLHSEEMANVTVLYSATPLFDEDDNGNLFDENGDQIIREDENGNVLDDE